MGIVPLPEYPDPGTFTGRRCLPALEAGAVSTGGPLPLSATPDPPAPDSGAGIGIPLPLLLMTPLEAESVALARGLSPFTGPIHPRRFGDRRSDLPRMPISVAFIGPGSPTGKRLSEKASEIGFRSVCLVGFAAGLAPDMECGTVRVLSRFVREKSPPLFALGAEEWSGWLGLEPGTGVTVDRIVALPGEKKHLNERTLADMADMESYPWMLEFMDAPMIHASVVRVVSDGPDTLLPPVVSRFVNADGSQNLLLGVRGIVRQPSSLVELAIALPGLLKGRASMTELGRRFGRLVSGAVVPR